MTSFTVLDGPSRTDLSVFLGRAKRVDDTAVRLQATGGVLALYVPVLAPRGILDSAPTILGMRALREGSGAEFDTVVTPAALLERLAYIGEVEGPTAISLPPVEVRVAWAGIATPRGGWHLAGEIPADALALAAREGAAEIAEAVPDNAGDPVVARVRGGVWGRALEAFPLVPAGVAFAADALGFLAPGETAQVFESGAWQRVSTQRGHVVVKRGGGL